jgi:hypothetical protein
MIRIKEVEAHELNQVFALCRLHADDMGLAGHDDMDDRWAKQQMKKMLINPYYRTYVAIKDMEWIGYAVVCVEEKLWNKKVYGEQILFFVRTDVRKGYEVADALMKACVDWFKEMECVYFQTSVAMFNADYSANEPVVSKARRYWTQYGMEEVGYTFVMPLDQVEEFYFESNDIEDY